MNAEDREAIRRLNAKARREAERAMLCAQVSILFAVVSLFALLWTLLKGWKP